MAKNLLSLVRNVARTGGNLFNQASKGYVAAMERTEAVLSSPRHSMPWPTGKCFPGQIGTQIIFSGRDSSPTAMDDPGYTTRPESLAGLPQGLVRG